MDIDKLIEEVARALYERNKKIAEKYRPEFPLPPYEHDTMGFYAGQALSAILATLRAALAVPNSDALAAALQEWCQQLTQGNPDYLKMHHAIEAWRDTLIKQIEAHDG